MQISFTSLGKGFSGLSVKAAILDLIWESIPVYTFSMATYYGSLAALIAATVLMIFVHRRYEAGNYVFHPRRPEPGK